MTFEGESEDLAQFAETEFGYMAPDMVHPFARQINNGHAALDRAGETAGSIPVTTSEGDQLARAEADGDYRKTMAMEGSTMAAWFEGVPETHR